MESLGPLRGHGPAEPLRGLERDLYSEFSLVCVCLCVCVCERRSETQALKTELVGDILAAGHSAGKGVGGWTVCIKVRMGPSVELRRLDLTKWWGSAGSWD